MNGKLARRLLAFLLTLVMLLCVTVTAMAEESGKKPVIGISWKSPTQNYEAFKKVIELAGGIPVELPQVIHNAVPYAETKVAPEGLEQSGMLKPVYANQIKARQYDRTNIVEVMKGVDAVFMTGGEDISPSLFKVPRAEANFGEEINAARDISDYTLEAYCIDNNIPIFAVCRGEQMMGIVHGVEFLQDIPAYYKLLGAKYSDQHRMPPGTPNRTYARHDVELVGTDSHLYEIVQAPEVKNISSWHHQAIYSLDGTELKLTARAVFDGVPVIEGIENPNKTFCVGVQFHPENDVKLALVDGKETPADVDVMLNFFKTLVKYAGR